jgi:RNA polymerase sigma factor (sigma-70 family)
MSRITEAEQYLIDQIRAGSEDAWSRFVEKYRRRLLNFARSRLPRRADAEDLIQDTFVAFISGLARWRGEASLETYLFTILRRKIINTYRSGYARHICLIQDVCGSGRGETDEDASGFTAFASDDHTASFYARRDEQGGLLRASLTDALESLVNACKKKLNFRDLQIIEMLFYCQLSNSDIARTIAVNETNIGVIKHRCLKQVKEHVAKAGTGSDLPDEGLDSMLTEVWESQRLSCPKRSTIGAYVLETLDTDWRDYVRFHLDTLGCQFCRANLDDIRTQTQADESKRIQERIMESTVGFLRKPG